MKDDFKKARKARSYKMKVEVTWMMRCEVESEIWYHIKNEEDV